MEEKLAQLNELIDGFNRLYEEEKRIILQKNKAQKNIHDLYSEILKDINPDVENRVLNETWIWELIEELTTGKVKQILLKNHRLITIMKKEE